MKKIMMMVAAFAAVCAFGWEIDGNGILTSVAGDLSGKIAIPEEIDDVPVVGLGVGLLPTIRRSPPCRFPLASD